MIFLAAIAALYGTMSVGLWVGRSVTPNLVVCLPTYILVSDVEDVDNVDNVVDVDDDIDNVDDMDNVDIDNMDDI